MNLWQALRYFTREAFVSALGNWQASLLAVLTCALSLFIGAFFFLVTSNLSNETDSWQSGLRISVFLNEGVSPVEIEELRTLVGEAAWISETTVISEDRARQRFEDAFPQVASALGSTKVALPKSIEGTLVQGQIADLLWDQWVSDLRSQPGVASVDDDRQWVREVQRFSLWVRTAGLTVSLALLIAAAFTIAAVVRLTAYQYLEEIAVLRLVGATEFFVRGPFVMEGLLQGFAGGFLAVSGVNILRLAALGRTEDSLWMDVLFGNALPLTSQAVVVLLGSIAGLVGAVLSIRRESLEVLDEDAS